ncbi:LysR family transcriptional regulator [Peribacillus frigoritolerans]|uniref:LysR family transcriptional regulator n=1 Tax=Peribacillus frigoritolerans TaxID=450367 RepID=UPI00345CBD96
MEIKQLIMFQTASKVLNFTKTAQILGYAQSSITVNILALEEELGTPLFERLGKRVFLTEAGAFFQEYADKILGLTEEALEVVGGINEPSGILRICASETQCTYRLPNILNDFQTKYPKVELVFRPGISEKDFLDLLLEGQIDVALLSMNPVTSTHLIVKELKEEPMAIVCCPSNPLSEKQEVLPLDLDNQRLLLTEECDYRYAFENLLTQVGAKPRSKLELADVEAIKKCVMAGLGIAILPEISVKREMIEGSIKKVNWGGSGFTTKIQLFWHKNKWMSPALKAFIGLTEEYILTNE